MRGLVVAPLVCWLGVAAPAAAPAQTASQPPSTTPAATPAQEKPAPAAKASEAEAEMPRSLFEPTWRQFEFGGRVSSVSGDPARWQRYQDLRDGVSFTDARYEREIQMARGCSTRQRTTSGFAISATSPITSAPAAS